jgi:hypothetical protein
MPRSQTQPPIINAALSDPARNPGLSPGLANMLARTRERD